MKLLLLFAGLVAAATAAHITDVFKHEWEAFKAQHNKLYKHAEEEKLRLKIYMENRLHIAQHNIRYHKGEVKFSMGVNKYSDMTNEEFVKTMNGFKRTTNNSRLNDPRTEGLKFETPLGFGVSLPTTVDWRKKGAVTPVKDQGHCGSCWSFSATGAIEGQHFRKSGVLVSLSEQNLVDCSTAYDNHGCNGGLMDNAFKYVKDNGGIDTEKTYPYEGIDDTCHYDPKNSGATDRGFVDIPQGDEEKLKQALANIGPVSVAIDASHQSFQMYVGGVYDEPSCDPANLDHGVLAVGYGTDEDGTDYWIVKNSWGTSWGDGGYIKMSRNKDNQCGIATAASYPLV